ncbi:altered inheritance of mitochondria protein 3-like [Aristolochia californica]|uniref:altered inheritance of mitochondria protein 3-like n=1 Tax=Aristolochia californica TaxID=171875 RepID=UPI0035E29B9B
MNSSQFMDKQIMGLSGSQSSDILDLLNSQEEQNGAGKKEEILPNYDFQPIRPVSASNIEGSGVGVARDWNSADSKTNASSLRNYGPQLSLASSKVTPEKERGIYETNMVSEFDRFMQKYTDNLLHAMDGFSARLSQIETRTHHLESSIDDLKVSIGNHHGSTDERLGQLENILREVHSGVQVLLGKQEIAEAQIQLPKLQASKAVDQSRETPNTTHTDGLQQSSQSVQPPPPPPVPLPQPTSLPPPNVPPPPASQQNPLPPPVSFPSQLIQSQMPLAPSLPRDPYYQSLGQPLDTTQTQFQIPSQQHQSVPHQPYQHISYSQPSQLPPQQQSIVPVTPQLQPQFSHHPDEHAYMAPPPPSYPPNMRAPAPLSQPPSGSPPPQQFYEPNSHISESSRNRSGSGQVPFLAGYGPPPPGPNLSESYPNSGSRYGGSVKQQGLSSPSAPSGGSGYSRLPTAQLLPQPIPTASSFGSGSTTGGSGNRVPMDDVVDKVTTMGFSRDQVRATVRKLTENGQSVDLNVVLDKLMKDGEFQQQKGWFGR